MESISTTSKSRAPKWEGRVPKMIANQTMPPRLGGQVTVIARGRVNPGEVSRDGNAVVFGEFRPGEGETVHRWKDGVSIQLNTDGHAVSPRTDDAIDLMGTDHSSYEARCNDDASVVTFHRYSLKDATDKNGNWDIARWEDGKVEVIASHGTDENTPDIDDSGNTIVYSRESEDGKKASIFRWSEGKTERLTGPGLLDWFPETSGDGSRVLWRRDIHDLYLMDQNGVTKPIAIEHNRAAGVMLDRKGEKLLYAAKDEDGDQDLYLKDLSNNTTTLVAGIKGMDEYQGYLSSDGSTVVYTGVDRRKDKSDMNIYLWKDGESKQLSYAEGGFNAYPSVSADGNAVSWFWVDDNDTTNRKLMLWQKDKPETT